MQHSQAARAAFQNDRNAGKATRDASRWTRALFVECRAILADEERKIRGHARRLQETYDARGELSGLMIRDFDTLKKLGMVRQDAKIRVLSELDGSEDVFESDEAAKDAVVRTEVEPGVAKTLPVSEAYAKEPSHDISQMPEGNSTPDRNRDISTSAAEKNLSDDDDDFDGFGVIKVIPATRNHRKDPGKTVGDEPSYVRPEAVSGAPNGMRVNVENKAGESVTTGDQDKERATGVWAVGKETVASGTDNDDAMKHDEDRHNQKQVNTGDEADGGPARRSGAETESHSGSNGNAKMEEFYKLGTGPDGLLMLGRKQTLRVCACCGGYISLVDAESRLLSHYGGKSHHSLALLREKVAELETLVADENRSAYEATRRDYVRSRREDREFASSRRDDRGRRQWEGSARRVRRHERDYNYRGYGSGDRYSSSQRSRESRGYREYDRHSIDDDRSRRERYGRHESSRKRYRSPSPISGGRRQRSRR